MQLTWADLGQLALLPKLRHLNCAGVKYEAGHSESLLLPSLLERLHTLVVGDSCTLSYIDDSLLALLGRHGKNLKELDCSGCIDITDQVLLGYVGYCTALAVDAYG